MYQRVDPGVLGALQSNNSCRGEIFFNDKKVFTIDGCITGTVSITDIATGVSDIQLIH